MKKIISFLIIVTSFVFATTLYAATNSVHEYQLPNGLKLFVKEDHRAPAVMVQIWYKAGSADEVTSKTGLAHVLEHMMFEGSKKYPNDSYMKIIAANGGNNNATTMNDYTYFYQTMKADKLPIALELEADRMQNLTLSDQSFAKEIKVIREERRMRVEDDPQGATFERLNATAFVSSPYHHDTVGWMRDLDHLTAQDARQWYETWYAPNNAIVVVAGDVDPEHVYQLVNQYFGAIPAKKLPARPLMQDQTQLGERDVQVNIPAQLPWLVMGYNTPTVPNAQVKWQPYAFAVLSAILTGNNGGGGRLDKDLVHKQQLATDVSVSYNMYSLLPNLFTFSGTPSQGHTIDQLKQAFLIEIKRLQTAPVSMQELQRIKNQVIAANIYAQDSLTAEATEIGSLEAVGLSWREADNFVSQVQQITPAQIQAVARQYLIPTRLTVASLLPAPTPNNGMQANKPLGVAHDQ
jgi:zinc protease